MAEAGRRRLRRPDAWIWIFEEEIEAIILHGQENKSSSGGPVAARVGDGGDVVDGRRGVGPAALVGRRWGRRRWRGGGGGGGAAGVRRRRWWGPARSGGGGGENAPRLRARSCGERERDYLREG
uniref:Uncharacterized protein n=1 Tax=Oryza sativa subsp. japonica TaxID=39947 RepID=Q5Z954_ORYSJ|nr:hypothetical protein [Oryza sativa Japonica Group]